MGAEVRVVEVAVVLNEPTPRPVPALTPETIRRLTRIVPIRRAVENFLRTERPRIEEAAQALRGKGKTSPLLDSWQKTLDPISLAPPTRYGDKEWAAWASRYVEAVRTKQTGHGVQGSLAIEWAVHVETVRWRVKRMRQLGWLQGHGHLVSEGPRLVAYQRNAAAADRQAREASG